MNANTLPSATRFAISRNAVIALAVVALHVVFIWTLQSGPLMRAAELVVPVELLSQLIEPPAPKVDTPAPTAKPAEPVKKQIAKTPVAPAPAIAAPPSIPEEISKVTSPSVEYALTNLGGGVARVALLKHAAERDLRMFLNDFSATPIGAVSFQQGDEVRAVHTGVADPVAGTATYEREMAGQLRLTKKFQFPRASDPEESLLKLDVTFTNPTPAAIAVPDTTTVALLPLEYLASRSLASALSSHTKRAGCMLADVGPIFTSS